MYCTFAVLKKRERERERERERTKHDTTVVGENILKTSKILISEEFGSSMPVALHVLM